MSDDDIVSLAYLMAGSKEFLLSKSTSGPTPEAYASDAIIVIDCMAWLRETAARATNPVHLLDMWIDFMLSKCAAGHTVVGVFDAPHLHPMPTHHHRLSSHERRRPLDWLPAEGLATRLLDRPTEWIVTSASHRFVHFDAIALHWQWRYLAPRVLQTALRQRRECDPSSYAYPGKLILDGVILLSDELSVEISTLRSGIVAENPRPATKDDDDDEEEEENNWRRFIESSIGHTLSVDRQYRVVWPLDSPTLIYTINPSSTAAGWTSYYAASSPISVSGMLRDMEKIPCVIRILVDIVHECVVRPHTTLYWVTSDPNALWMGLVLVSCYIHHHHHHQGDVTDAAARLDFYVDGPRRVDLFHLHGYLRSKTKSDDNTLLSTHAMLIVLACLPRWPTHAVRHPLGDLLSRLSKYGVMAGNRQLRLPIHGESDFMDFIKNPRAIVSMIYYLLQHAIDEPVRKPAMATARTMFSVFDPLTVAYPTAIWEAIGLPRLRYYFPDPEATLASVECATWWYHALFRAVTRTDMMHTSRQWPAGGFVFAPLEENNAFLRSDIFLSPYTGQLGHLIPAYTGIFETNRLSLTSSSRADATTRRASPVARYHRITNDQEAVPRRPVGFL